MIQITPTLSRAALSGVALLALAGCGRDVTPTGHKLAGVGHDPTEIGPFPEEHGGYIEYSWVEFAGGALPLGLLGLVSYEEAGPGLISFRPPYAAVTGMGFIFETDAPNPDTLFGNWAPAPAQEGSCYTSIDPRSYLNSIADVGGAIVFESEDGGTRYDIGRRPQLYGTNVEEVFPYYFDFNSWRAAPLTYKSLPEGSTSLTDFEDAALEPSNFTFGEEVTVSFPGALPPAEASFGAIPVPLAAAGGERSYRLPTRPSGVMLEWSGPRYDAWGRPAGEGEQTACLQYVAHPDQPLSPDDCLEPAPMPSDLEASDASIPAGQIYTGPWDSEGGVTFRWMPSEDPTVDEVVTISVRFLGPVDMDDENKLERVVTVPPSSDVRDEWSDLQEDGLIPSDASLPDGRRAATACEDEAEWVFDDALQLSDGSMIPSLRGEPSHRLAEVTCRVSDASGEFTITQDMLESALDYARRYDSEGAIFYVARTTSMDLETPPVRDAYGNRRDISSVKVVSNAVSLGRFWFEN